MNKLAKSMLRAEAAKTLGISQEGSAEDARAAFLKQLTECEFVPSKLCREAVAELAGVPFKYRDNLRLHAEQTLREQIELFAREEFWKLSPSERITKWNNLREFAAPYPKQLSRLQDLEAGLEIETPTPGKPRESDLAEAILKRFAMPRLERSEHQNDRAQFSIFEKNAVAESLSRQYPELVKIDRLSRGYLLNENAPARNQKYETQPIRSKSLSKKTGSSQGIWWGVIFVVFVIKIALVVISNKKDPEIKQPSPTIMFPSNPAFKHDPSQIPPVLLKRRIEKNDPNSNQKQFSSNPSK